MEPSPPAAPPPPPGYQTTVFRAQPTEGAQRKIQKRNRPPVSCLLCRTRKVKCDRQQPCERCIKSGEANFCEYAPRAARKPRGAEPRVQPEVRAKPEAVSKPVLQVRLQKLEEMVNGLVTSGAFTEPSLNTPSSSDQRTEIDARSDLSSPPSLSAPSGSLPVGSRTGEGNYVGSTHWASILESIHDIQGILDAEADVHPSPSPPPSSHAWSTDCRDLIYGKGEMITHEQAVARLPRQDLTDRLVLLYFRHRFTTAPYIHTTKFQKEYDSFWRDPRSVSLLWISCLASILWIATSIALAKGETGLSDTPRPEQLSILAVDCLISGDYLAAKPYSIEALLLHGFTEMKRKHVVDSSLWAKFGLTARLAQRMGYHRDPKYLSNVTPFEGEIRRRAWFFIEVFDVLFSFQQGVPPIIRDDECDTESPANLYDADFDENMLVLPPSRPASEPTTTLYLCVKSKLCRILRRILRLTLSIQSPAYEEVLKLNDELHHFHNSIPTPLQIRPIRSYSFTDQTYDIMHRLMLEIMFLKSLCVLHRPYLNREKDNPQCEISRTTCREAALKMLDLHAEYEDESKPGGRMYEDKYMLSSLTVHDFLIASMIICLDLTENFPSSSTERSRKLKALGTSYKIWSDCKETSKEAAHAARVVGAILRRVSMQDFPQARPPPPPPQTDIRDGSLAILLNNDVQLSPPPSIPYDHSHLLPAMDFSLEFVDIAPIDNVLKESSIVDWTLLDHVLLERPESTYRPTAL
ncbi:fungal-specific transcription factor domain-containing protein [Nemania sp. FL0916]|nr:fungal-specific transcription factor domain-containing protein [Nemania sp. FL0916]